MLRFPLLRVVSVLSRWRMDFSFIGNLAAVLGFIKIAKSVSQVSSLVRKFSLGLLKQLLSLSGVPSWLPVDDHIVNVCRSGDQIFFDIKP